MFPEALLTCHLVNSSPILYCNQFIFLCSDSNLFGMFKTSLPVCVRMDHMEFVVTFEVFVAVFVRKSVACLKDRGVDDEVGTSLVEGNRVE